jgi:hypothetical protein
VVGYVVLVVVLVLVLVLVDEVVVGAGAGHMVVEVVVVGAGPEPGHDGPGSASPYTRVEKLSSGHDTCTLNNTSPERLVSKPEMTDVPVVAVLEATDAAKPETA